MWLLFVTRMIRWAAMAGSYLRIHSLAASHLDEKERKDFSLGAGISSCFAGARACWEWKLMLNFLDHQLFQGCKVQCHRRSRK